LFVSATHGGYAFFVFSGMESALLACERPSGCATADWFDEASGTVFRIETGPILAVYDIGNCCLLSRELLPPDVVTGFRFGDDGFVFLRQDPVNKTTSFCCIANGSSQTIDCPLAPEEDVSGFARIAPSTGYLWTKRSHFLLKSDLTWRNFDKSKGVAVRVFPIDERRCFVTGQCEFTVSSAICRLQSIHVQPRLPPRGMPGTLAPGLFCDVAMNMPFWCLPGLQPGCSGTPIELKESPRGLFPFRLEGSSDGDPVLRAEFVSA
jgi:hypothetical protein